MKVSFLSQEDFVYVHPTKIVVKKTVTTYEIYCEREPGISSIEIMKPMAMFAERPRIDQFTQDREAILTCIGKLRREFNDLEQRQINFVVLKDEMVSLRNKLTLAQRDFLRCVNMCIDSLDNIRAENISEEQLKALESVIGMACSTTEHFEANLLQQILIKSGLKPIPNLEGVSELYG